MIESAKYVRDLIRSLFDSDEVSDITYESMQSLKVGDWEYINNNKIGYKKIEDNKDFGFMVFLTEWFEDSEFRNHMHSDADEEIIILKGELTDNTFKRTKKAHGRFSYKSETIHSVSGKKGTLISVKFTKKIKN